MATTTETQITVESSGEGIEGESKWEPTAMSNNTSPAGGPVRTALTAGDNTIAVPTGAMGLVFTPPAHSAAVLKLKGGAGETGFALRTGQPAAIPLPTGTASVLMNASEAVLLYLHWT